MLENQTRTKNPQLLRKLLFSRGKKLTQIGKRRSRIPNEEKCNSIQINDIGENDDDLKKVEKKKERRHSLFFSRSFSLFRLVESRLFWRARCEKEEEECVRREKYIKNDFFVVLAGSIFAQSKSKRNMETHGMKTLSLNS